MPLPCFLTVHNVPKKSFKVTLCCVSTKAKSKVCCVIIYTFSESMPSGNRAQCPKKCYFFTFCISNFTPVQPNSKKLAYSPLKTSANSCLSCFCFVFTTATTSLQNVYRETALKGFLQPVSSCETAVLMLCHRFASKIWITVEDESKSIPFPFLEASSRNNRSNHLFPCLPTASNSTRSWKHFQVAGRTQDHTLRLSGNKIQFLLQDNAQWQQQSHHFWQLPCHGAAPNHPGHTESRHALLPSTGTCTYFRAPAANGTVPLMQQLSCRAWRRQQDALRSAFQRPAAAAPAPPQAPRRTPGAVQPRPGPYRCGQPAPRPAATAPGRAGTSAATGGGEGRLGTGAAAGARGPFCGARSSPRHIQRTLPVLPASALSVKGQGPRSLTLTVETAKPESFATKPLLLPASAVWQCPSFVSNISKGHLLLLRQGGHRSCTANNLNLPSPAAGKPGTERWPALARYLRPSRNPSGNKPLRFIELPEGHTILITPPLASIPS